MRAIIETSMHLRAGQDALALMSLRGYIGRQDYILNRTLATPVAALDAWLRFRTGDRAGAEPICHRLAHDEAGTIEGDIATRCLRAWDASDQGRRSGGPAPAEPIGEVHPPATSSTTMEDLTRRYLTGRSVTLAPPPTVDDDLNAGHPPSRVRDLWRQQRFFAAMLAKYGAHEVEEFDPDVLRRRQEEEAAEAEALYRQLPGYAEIRRRFSMGPARLGGAVGHGYCLSVRLDAREPAPLVNCVSWSDPVDEETGKPLLDWNDFVSTLATVEHSASPHAWLRRWRDASSDRQVQAEVVGRIPTSETDLDFSILPAWQHAGLRGRPTIELVFRRGNEWRGRAFLGPEDPRALITTFRPGTSDHWLDGLTIDFHPLFGRISYVVVDGDGHHRVCDELADDDWKKRMRDLLRSRNARSSSQDHDATHETEVR